jgi:hypothetical protein
MITPRMREIVRGRQFALSRALHEAGRTFPVFDTLEFDLNRSLICRPTNVCKENITWRISDAKSFEMWDGVLVLEDPSFSLWVEIPVLSGSTLLAPQVVQLLVARRADAGKIEEVLGQVSRIVPAELGSYLQNGLNLEAGNPSHLHQLVASDRMEEALQEAQAMLDAYTDRLRRSSGEVGECLADFYERKPEFLILSPESIWEFETVDFTSWFGQPDHCACILVMVQDELSDLGLLV